MCICETCKREVSIRKDPSSGVRTPILHNPHGEGGQISIIHYGILRTITPCRDAGYTCKARVELNTQSRPPEIP